MCKLNTVARGKKKKNTNYPTAKHIPGVNFQTVKPLSCFNKALKKKNAGQFDQLCAKKFCSTLSLHCEHEQLGN